MYLVLSTFTSSPISLLATINTSAFSFIVCHVPNHNVKNLQTNLRHDHSRAKIATSTLLWCGIFKVRCLSTLPVAKNVATSAINEC